MPAIPSPDDLPVLTFDDAAAFEAWLEDGNADGPGVWIAIAKKATKIPTVTHQEALDLALCFGWIDGQRRALDDERFLQRFVPRRARSTWSKINCSKVEALIEQGRMRPAGHAEIERAKADGRWDVAYDGQRTATVPEDLRRALDAEPAATRAFFDALDSHNRYAILFRVGQAKKPETRARRIATFVAMCREGRKLHE
jgi:uncharacterized protein YdeI (YjbR/CyaY-like superfamily)